ncbi:MAG: hypothetical protein A3K19_27300 [Lentisphaerae bacterium RIFOXYB12_FULL_65_16]|nr:MAG: hypothetical protein A3K18_15975 [Lentisphaerae bacterium RIFOXYA12_64_32]OGV86397.1 MAG: hypothetical protein A3K19_27300 [Lentisphaerae bacterium RIFOXYB12_FULL_65_16]
MNITLSAEDELVKRSRAYAAQHGMSLNRMLRSYMRQVSGLADLERDAAEFACLAREHGGASPAGFAFNRDEAHRR